jgi:hypothetical protein
MTLKKESKSKRGIFLMLPESMLERLKKEKENFSYDSIQEVIKEVLRDKFFRQPRKGESKRGRKKERIDLLKVGSAKRIFK